MTNFLRTSIKEIKSKEVCGRFTLKAIFVGEEELWSEVLFDYAPVLSGEVYIAAASCDIPAQVRALYYVCASLWMCTQLEMSYNLSMAENSNTFLNFGQLL